MWPFRRRSPRGGKHLRGARVTRVPAPPVDRPRTVAVPPVPAVPARLDAGPRVELGFRDGSTATLVLNAAQAKAFNDATALLVGPHAGIKVLASSAEGQGTGRT
jgi:hypothetical protein